MQRYTAADSHQGALGCKGCLAGCCAACCLMVGCIWQCQINRLPSILDRAGALPSPHTSLRMQRSASSSLDLTHDCQSARAALPLRHQTGLSPHWCLPGSQQQPRRLQQPALGPAWAEHRLSPQPGCGGAWFRACVGAPPCQAPGTAPAACLGLCPLWWRLRPPAWHAPIFQPCGMACGVSSTLPCSSCSVAQATGLTALVRWLSPRLSWWRLRSPAWQ